MYFVLFNDSGEAIFGPQWRDEFAGDVIANYQADHAQPNYAWTCEDVALPSHIPAELKATIENDEIVNVEKADQPKIYLHIEIGGGDGLDPVGIANDGVTGANVTITLREGADPASPLFTVVGNPINITWRVPIMRGDRQIWAKVKFVNSVATGVYRTKGEPGLLRLAPELLDPVTLPDGQGSDKTYGFAAGDGSATKIIVAEELAAV